jgi:hypothetical protein
MTAIPRILVVDPSSHLGPIVRAAMAMLDRRYILVEIPTANEALDEVFGTEVDLAVTSYTLDSNMTGIEWAERAIRERAGAQIVVVAERNDPRPDDALLKNAFFQFVPRASGERFLRAVRIGLDGQEVVEAEESSGEGLDLGPVPDIETNQTRQVLIRTIGEIGAIGGLIADRAGRIVVDEGATSYVDKEQIAPLLGPAFAQVVKVSPQIGGDGFLLKYYEGDQYLLFGLSIGYHYFMMILLTPSRGALGSVTRYGRQGAREIADLLGDAAWRYTEAASEAEETTEAAEEAPSMEDSQQMTAEQITSKLMAPTLEPVGDMDIDSLFGDVPSDDSEFDDLFGDEMGLDDLLDDDGSVSYEEAQDMGLLGD